MSIKIVQDKLNTYTCVSQLDEEHAIREMTQEIALAALGRTDFFKHVVFQGGTCLRIFHSLSRFSEDMDFLLRQADRDFSLQSYMNDIVHEMAAYGYHLEIAEASNSDATVKKAFLKDDSLVRLLQLQYPSRTGPMQKIRIKFEVDTNPPEGSGYEIKYVDFPFVTSVIIQDIASLFAGKLHALLCRQYVKGRDWYDFLWYTSRGAGINLPFLSAALDQQGTWQGRAIRVDLNWCREQLEKTIVAIDWDSVREDVKKFIRPNEHHSLDLWNRDLFLAQLDKIR